MTDETPDTAIAQTLTTLAAIRPIALSCIGAGSAVLVLSILIFGSQGIFYALLQTAIMAVVSFTATRHFLSDGNAVLLSPAQTLRASGFIPFVQLELLITVAFEIIERLSNAPEVLAVLGFPGLLFTIFFLAKYGTVFPAIVAGDDTSLTAADERGTTGALLFRLMAAYGLGFIMITAFILLPSLVLEQSFGIGSTLGIGLTAPLIVGVNVIVSVLIAVILSKAYQGRYQT